MRGTPNDYINIFREKEPTSQFLIHFSIIILADGANFMKFRGNLKLAPCLATLTALHNYLKNILDWSFLNSMAKYVII